MHKPASLNENKEIVGENNDVEPTMWNKLNPALDFKDAADPWVGYRDVVFDAFIEKHFLNLISLLSNFSKLFQLFRYHWTKTIWLYIKSTTNSVH